jgi:hypothetical protein
MHAHIYIRVFLHDVYRFLVPGAGKHDRGREGHTGSGQLLQGHIGGVVHANVIYPQQELGQWLSAFLSQTRLARKTTQTKHKKYGVKLFHLFN